MKFIKLLGLFFLTSSVFIACENRMDINDIVAGTPTNADSVLAPSKHQPFQPKELDAFKDSLPIVFRR